jgi:hypothetical protein
MLVKTSTWNALWCLVEGNDKYWARAKVLAKLVEILSKELDYEPADPLKRGKRKKKLSAVGGQPPGVADRLRSWILYVQLLLVLRLRLSPEGKPGSFVAAQTHRAIVIVEVG